MVRSEVWRFWGLLLVDFGGLELFSGFGDSVGEGGFGKREEIRERERDRDG